MKTRALIKSYVLQRGRPTIKHLMRGVLATIN